MNGLGMPHQDYTSESNPAKSSVVSALVFFGSRRQQNTTCAHKTYFVCLVGEQHRVHEVVDDAVEPRAQPAARDDGTPHLRRVKMQRRSRP